MTNEKEKTCVWETVPMGEWMLYRTACGAAKYTKDRNWSTAKCGNCGGVVILEPKS